MNAALAHRTLPVNQSGFKENRFTCWIARREKSLFIMKTIKTTLFSIFIFHSLRARKKKKRRKPRLISNDIREKSKSTISPDALFESRVKSR